MMTKKEYLRSYLESIAHEKELNEQLNRLRSDFALPKSQGMDGMPHAFNSEHDLSDYVARLDGLMLTLQRSVQKRIDLRSDITKRIESMDSETEKTLLHMRYISGRTFEQIAVRLSYTYRWVIHLHGNALNHFPYP